MTLMHHGALLLGAAWSTYAYAVPPDLTNGTSGLVPRPFDNTTLSGGYTDDVLSHNVVLDRNHKFSFPETFDRHGMERALYHVTHYMAQRGRDRVLRQCPDFAKMCHNDADCSLSVEGLPDSITQDVVNRKPAQHGAGFGPEDFLNHASWKEPQAELDSAIQTLMIKEVYEPEPKLDKLHKTVTKNHDLTTWLRVLHKQSNDGDQDTPHVGDIKKALRRARKVSTIESGDFGCTDLCCHVGTTYQYSNPSRKSPPGY